MKPPQGLGADGRRAWRHATATLIAIGADADLFAEQLRRLAVLADDLAGVRGEWVAAGSPATGATSRGQGPHPMLRAMAALRAEILTLEDALGLTLEAQRRLGRHVRAAGRGQGAASAPDRAAGARRVVPFRLPDVVEQALRAEPG